MRRAECGIRRYTSFGGEGFKLTAGRDDTVSATSSPKVAIRQQREDQGSQDIAAAVAIAPLDSSISAQIMA